jgi:hypothetical protein
LKKLAKRLRELDIPYAVVGGMALSAHGFPRFTVDVNVLVTPESLKEIHNHLDGLGYIPQVRHSKNLRDAETGVKIEFLITGGFPGDGKPKPVAFPDPREVSVENDGVHYINLPTLIELKIASGMTSSERLKDLGDVQELIKVLNLSQDFGDALNPYVREKYEELWRGAHPSGKRFVILWREMFPSTDQSAWFAIESQPSDVAASLRLMQEDGVSMESFGDHGVAYLVTSEPEIASKYGMHDESEYWHEHNL